MPRYHVEGGMALLSLVSLICVLDQDGPLAVCVLVERSNRGLEVSDICKAVGTDRPKLWKCEVVLLVGLQDIAPCRTLRQGDPVADPPRNDSNFVRANEQLAEFRLDIKNPMLGHDQEVAVARAERAVLSHVFACCEDHDTDTTLHGRVACTRYVAESGDPITRVIKIEGVPTHLVWNVVQALRFCRGGTAVFGD